MNPFDYITAINETKKNLIVDETTEKGYNPYFANRTLSYFPETLHYANEMNIKNHLDKKLQFDYLLNRIRPAKRYAKWGKKKDKKAVMTDLELVQEYFGINTTRAKEALSILSKSQIKTIKEKLEKGG
jgi:hypothetical protein